ncbi:MAG TPA: ABC transporter ATP-binding protein [Thermoanaerobaculia bacterium]|jgi:ABC-2 type transport system ATP-binding protein|nr:ABC transporter ATP-binding protein [Thermoanaerobaculia bacterium]
MIEIRDLVKTYDGFAAVDGLSLAVAGGEIVGLVGPNGAGKTTTLRCLAGILPPTSGRIAVAGYDLETQPIEARRRLAFVPDEPRLFENLTVADHMKVIGRIYGVADAAERSRQLLAAMELADRPDAFPAELSRGMKQKLMIALALLHRPDALILDEPLTGLDPGAIRRMKRTIVEQARAGAAVLVSSHLLALVQEICGRVVIVQHGRQVLAGTLAEIRAALPGLAADADLEEIFLRATEGAEADAAPAPGSPGNEPR